MFLRLFVSDIWYIELSSIRWSIDTRTGSKYCVEYRLTVYHLPLCFVPCKSFFPFSLSLFFFNYIRERLELIGCRRIFAQNRSLIDENSSFHDSSRCNRWQSTWCVFVFLRFFFHRRDNFILESVDGRMWSLFLLISRFREIRG